MKKLLLPIALLIPTMALAATIVKPFSFVTGQVISSSQMNQTVDAIVTELNSKETRITTSETVTNALRAISTQTADYAVLSTDYVIVADATAANVTITLPAAATSTGQSFIVKRIDATGNTLTVDGNGSNIDGAGTYAGLIAQYDRVTVVSDGTQWHITAK